MSPIVPAKRVLVRKSDGWQDIALQGPPGPPGGQYELASAVQLTDVAVTGTSPAAANTIITLPSVSFDGVTTVDIEFWCRAVYPPAGVNNYVAWALYDNGVFVGTNAPVAFNPLAAAGFGSPQKTEFRITPSAGAHVFTIRGWVPSGTASFSGGQNPGSCMIAKVKRVVTTPLLVTTAVPRARVYRNTDMSAAANVYTAIPYTTERWDTDGMWEPAAPTRLTAKTAGLYEFGANAIWEDISGPQGSYRGMSFRVNGSTHVGTDWRGISGPVGTCRQQVSGQWYLNANDYLEAVVIHDRSYSGTYYASALRSVAGESLEFWAARIGS